MSDQEVSKSKVEAVNLAPAAATPICPIKGGAHKALASVLMSRSVRRLQRDHRGYPVPFMVVQSPINLAVIDPLRHREGAQRKLCGVCGERLGNKKWFVGGNITVTNRLFLTLPMHEECARYSLRVCPFLSNPAMKYRNEAVAGSANPNVSPTRPHAFYLLRTNGYTTAVIEDTRYIMANEWEYAEEWRDGERVSLDKV